jgi:beta-lactamase regulating signal transducer with metallopeptidase domain
MIGAIVSGAIAGAAEMSFAIRTVLGATAIWVLATIVCVLLGRSSAALRHRVWSMSAAACLALPALLLVLPQWRVGGGVRLAPETLADVTPPVDGAARAAEYHKPLPLDANVTSELRRTAAISHRPQPTAPAAPARSRDAARWWLFTIWLTPAAWLTLRQLLALADAWSLVGRAVPVGAGQVTARLAQLSNRLGVRVPPRLLESPEPAVPLCLGWLRPCIVLPLGFGDAPTAQMDAVLTHELANVARRDICWQLLARLACGVYWFHPLAWVAAGRMRVERELACDDWVLAGGESSTRYARWLLDLASAPRPRMSGAEGAGVAMVGGGGGFERRIAALLDPSRRRFALSRRCNVLIASAALIVIVAAGVLDPFAPRVMAAAPVVRPAVAGSMPAQNPDSIGNDRERKLAQIEARALEMLREVRQLRAAANAQPSEADLDDTPFSLTSTGDRS